ncbi:hypothetical protein QBC32DRAFT_356904, partial [Pseudoneurospora amorphoporcata]
MKDMPKRQLEGSLGVAFVLISRLPASLRAKPYASMLGGRSTFLVIRPIIFIFLAPPPHLPSCLRPNDMDMG